MRHEFRLADIGEGLEEAEIISWLVAVGDDVTRDQPLIEVMTDKSNAELPAPTAGTIVELGGAVGDLITVGELIAVIVETDIAAEPHAAADLAAAVSEARPSAIGAAAVLAPPLPGPAGADDSVVGSPSPSPARVKASPSTRRQAAERGIDLATIVGTGPGGRILLSDLATPQTAPAIPAVQPIAAVQPVAAVVAQTPSAMQLPPTEPAVVLPEQAAGVVPLRGVRRAVAKNMAQSWSDIPHIHAFGHIDAAPLIDLRKRLRATARPAYEHLTPLAFFVAAVTRALAAHPQANASLDMDAETITYNPNVNVGIAVASPAGLVVPVLQAANLLDFAALSAALNELITGAREGSLSADHFRGGTVTITNFGALGGEQATPLIRPSESMIIGFGSIATRPFVLDDQVVATPTLHTVAGADHRLLDGDTTTAVLCLVNELLNDPLQLVL